MLKAQVTQLWVRDLGGFGGGRAGQVMELIEANLNQIRTTAGLRSQRVRQAQPALHRRDAPRAAAGEAVRADVAAGACASAAGRGWALGREASHQASPASPGQRRRGRLDIRRTLRSALASGGIPSRCACVTVGWRSLGCASSATSPIRCGRCRASCTCSSSTRWEMFSKVRSFVFVSDLGEATDLFARHDLEQRGPAGTERQA